MPAGMIGKVITGSFKHGFKSLGAGLSSGSLSNPKVWGGLGLVSMGALGTTAIIRAVTASRDRMRKRRQMRTFGRQF